MALEPIWVAFVTVVLVGCLILGARASGAGATESGPPVLALLNSRVRQLGPAHGRQRGWGG